MAKDESRPGVAFDEVVLDNLSDEQLVGVMSKVLTEKRHVSLLRSVVKSAARSALRSPQRVPGSPQRTAGSPQRTAETKPEKS